MSHQGYYRHKEDIDARLRRIEGQVRGIQKMVDSDAYCIDILTQVSAVGNALKKVAVGLLDDHMRHCIVEGRQSDREEKVAEASAAIERLLKS
ncbi:MAG: metal-sensitive transcriptional regulator [Actinomycetota bacterium]